MSSVKFSALDDLLNELGECDVDNKLVRLAVDHMQVNSGVTNVGIHVSFRVDGELYFMEGCAGEDVAGGKQTGTDEAKTIAGQVREKCAQRGYELRGGIIED